MSSSALKSATLESVLLTMNFAKLMSRCVKTLVLHTSGIRTVLRGVKRPILHPQSKNGNDIFDGDCIDSPWRIAGI